MLFLRLCRPSLHPVEASFQMPGRLHLQSNYNQRRKPATFRIKSLFCVDRQTIHI